MIENWLIFPNDENKQRTYDDKSVMFSGYPTFKQTNPHGNFGTHEE